MQIERIVSDLLEVSSFVMLDHEWKLRHAFAGDVDASEYSGDLHRQLLACHLVHASGKEWPCCCECRIFGSRLFFSPFLSFENIPESHMLFVYQFHSEYGCHVSASDILGKYAICISVYDHAQHAQLLGPCRLGSDGHLLRDAIYGLAIRHGLRTGAEVNLRTALPHLHPCTDLLTIDRIDGILGLLDGDYVS